ncbi:MAG: amidohydrolase family protein [Phenylobacterium sp.]|uniref:amidohydrolase family protein n=1 Tax=Phenylobacterium sp. TaxID=1871053 RepID=UPI002735C009|nr:amidohydrolase family protein [Phenylobacterium sp.]MDP3750026.1 amidohydrolase family protein [Phenylobacterium sp.]
MATATTADAIPAALLPFAGEILDVDSHEHVPSNHWVNQFGPAAQRMQDAVRNSTYVANESKDVDDAEINAENVWKLKRMNAPGTFDISRRPEVLKFLGVKRQMLFPGAFGIKTIRLLAAADNPAVCLPTITGDRRRYALDLVDAYNDWAAHQTISHKGVVAVAIVAADGTPEDLIEETRKLIKKGVRSIWIRTSNLPGGVSPAHEALDPWYEMLSDANITICTHVGGDSGFLATEGWHEAAAFNGFKMGDEFSLDPWTLVNLSRGPENYISTMVLGGVFERHPNLRVLMAEVSADWIGPLARRMDMWVMHSGAFHRQNVHATKQPPSEYIKRNVRVSPFEFEDVGKYITDYGLEDVYCYASDFPHLEGGTEPMRRLLDSLRSHGHSDTVIRKFFVENAKWVLPD